MQESRLQTGRVGQQKHTFFHFANAIAYFLKGQIYVVITCGLWIKLYLWAFFICRMGSPDGGTRGDHQDSFHEEIPISEFK